MAAQQKPEIDWQKDKVAVEVPKDVVWHFFELKGVDLAYYIDRRTSAVYELDRFLDKIRISVHPLPDGSLADVVSHILNSLKCPNCCSVHARVGIFERKLDEIKTICVPAVGEECVEKVRRQELRGSSGLSL